MFVVFGIFSCKKLENTTISEGTFQTNIPHHSLGTSIVDFSISYDTLFKWIGLGKGKELYNSKLDKNAAFPLKLIQEGPFRVVSVVGNKIQLSVPISWEAEPSLSGFSAGIVRGKMQLQIKSQIDLSDFQQMNVKETELEYQWLEKPNIKVMGFGVNVTGLIDQLIKSKKSMIIDNINNYSNGVLQFNQWEKSITELLKPILFQDIVFHNYNTSVDLSHLSLNNSGLNGTIRIKSHIELTDKWNVLAYNLPQNVRLEKLNEDTISKIDFNLNVSFEYIKKIIAENLKAEYKSSKINFDFSTIDSSGVMCEVAGIKGEKSLLQVKWVPTIKSVGKLGVQPQVIQLKDFSFPTSLLKKSAERRIFKQLNLFEYDINSKIEALLASNQLVENQGYQLKLNTISWNKQSINLAGVVEGRYSLKK